MVLPSANLKFAKVPFCINLSHTPVTIRKSVHLKGTESRTAPFHSFHEIFYLNFFMIWTNLQKHIISKYWKQVFYNWKSRLFKLYFCSRNFFHTLMYIVQMHHIFWTLHLPCVIAVFFYLFPYVIYLSRQVWSFFKLVKRNPLLQLVSAR